MTGTVTGTVNSLTTTVGALLKNVGTVITNLIAVLVALAQAVNAVSTQLPGVLISVTALVNKATVEVVPIVNQLTIVVGSSEQLVIQVTVNLEKVFSSLNSALPSIVLALGNVVSTTLTLTVSTNLADVEESLKIIIGAVSQSGTIAAYVVAHAVANVVVTAQELVKSVKAVVASVVEIVEIVAQVVEAVNALVVVLSGALKIVLQFVAKSAELFKSLPSEVQHVLRKAVYSLSWAVKGVAKIVGTITTAVGSDLGAVAGLNENVPSVLASLEIMVSNFMSNVTVINKILETEAVAVLAPVAE